MRKPFIENIKKDPRIVYRGEETTRLDNLTDAIFGFAITLLVFTIQDAHTFSELMHFAKTFPALLIGIIFLITIWREHVSFSIMYSFNDAILRGLNILFIALIIFYVYPLRFLTRLLTNLFFNTNIELNISGEQIPQLMIFYGLVVFALYFTIYLFYLRVLRSSENFNLNSYELAFTKFQKNRIIIMFFIPLLSISIVFLLSKSSILWACLLGGLMYGLYPPAILFWQKRFNKMQEIIQIEK